jgi:hypothetical protein
MSGTIYSEHWPEVEPLLQLFFPQFFDPQSPQYVDPDIMAQLSIISDEARAYFIAYLVSLRHETTSGSAGTIPVAGPIISEKEGDIAVTYADMTKTGMATMSKRPPSNPWDVWNRYWMRCAAGTITTRYGDPCRNGVQFTLAIWPRVMGIWYPIW